MLSETTMGLAEKFRQNWQTQYPYLSLDKSDPRNFQSNFPKRNIKNPNSNYAGYISNVNPDPEDDSLTNLNWLQNLNLFSMSQTQPPLSPSPTHQISTLSPQYPLAINTMNQLNRVIPQYFESSSLYEEVAMNLEFMNDEASVHFFKVNNQLRPPFSEINLISMAIHSFNKFKVSFPEICQWIEETFPYYKSLPENWRTGIKNNLTLSKCFQKVPRRRDEVEKGGFWRFSNDFLNYFERSRMQRMSSSNNYDEKSDNSCENIQPDNQYTFKFGKITNRKRSINSIMTQDENRHSAFRIPKRKWFFNDLVDQNALQLANINQPHNENSVNELHECKSAESLLLQYQDDSRQSMCSMNQLNLPISTGSNDSMTNISLTVLATVDMSQQQGSNSIFNHNIVCSQMNQASTNASSPCPEQVTEEEFLSGQAFNNNYITLNSNAEHMPSLLDTQNTFTSNDFNISDLSITGIGLKPPEWWNQSFSASQISLSKFNCSFRSLAVANNGETASPFCVGGDEDHHVGWPNDLSNLAELDMLFGLS